MQRRPSVERRRLTEDIQAATGRPAWAWAPVVHREGIPNTVYPASENKNNMGLFAVISTSARLDAYSTVLVRLVHVLHAGRGQHDPGMALLCTLTPWDTQVVVF